MAFNSALAPAGMKPTFNLAFTQALDRHEDVTAVNPPNFSSVCLCINTAQLLGIMWYCCLVITQKWRRNRLNTDKPTQGQPPPPQIWYYLPCHTLDNINTIQQLSLQFSTLVGIQQSLLQQPCRDTHQYSLQAEEVRQSTQNNKSNQNKS